MSPAAKVALFSALMAVLCLAVVILSARSRRRHRDISQMPDEALRIRARWDKDDGEPMNLAAEEYVRRHGHQRRGTGKLFFDGRLTESEADAGKAEPDPAGLTTALFNWGQACSADDIDRKIVTRKVLIATIRADRQAAVDAALQAAAARVPAQTGTEARP